MKIDKTAVIGMIASVLVNLTVTAVSNVWLPKWWRLSQVEVAAVTEEVSLMAVPAKETKGAWLAKNLILKKDFIKKSKGRKANSYELVKNFNSQ